MTNEGLSKSFQNWKTESEMFHDLMSFKVREILLVATIYDAFTLEQDGLIAEKIFGEYYQLNLTSAPRITSVNSGKEAIEILETKTFDLVVVMSRFSRIDSLSVAEVMKGKWPDLPVLLLINDNAELGLIDSTSATFKFFDSIFVWNGNSEIFLAMIKFVEDFKNADADTELAQVRIILLVEDSIKYYSRYLPHLYTELIKQTTKLVEEELHDETKKVLKMRCRPKIILATTYEDAMEQFEHYREFVLCVISDVKFPKDNILDERAGVKLIKELRLLEPDLPVLLQSSEAGLQAIADELRVSFIHKEVEFLSNGLTKFFYNNLGFGDFVFRTPDRREIARAHTMDDLRDCLRIVPAESIKYHAERSHFSTWLLARGEVQTAKIVFQIGVDEFGDLEQLRDFLMNMGAWVRKLRTRGKTISFDKVYRGEDTHISKFTEGSIGGKGRGIAFINYLLHNSGLSVRIPGITVKIPKTIVIGTDEFTNFLVNNHLDEYISSEKKYENIRQRFVEGRLSDKVVKRLRYMIDAISSPLAVRSSGVLEDSVSYPLSGLYETYFLPNNHPNFEVRLQQVVDAIKLVYASIYSKEAREYFDAINYNIEEEKMAVVIQQVVGKRHGNHFYPHISGVGQSYNYYPFSYIKPDDGVGMVALGLGTYVVGGEKSHRFCPSHPKLMIFTPEELVKNSQKKFYAIDLTKDTVDLMKGEDATLVKLDLRVAEKDGVLDDITSTWNHLDKRFEVGIVGRGPRVIDFANILQYDAIPLAQTLKQILEVSHQAMETPVEIEFAVDLNPENSSKPVFYLLQIKHMVRDAVDCVINKEVLQNEQLILYSNLGMGNGRIDGLTDIIWLDPDKFDKTQTEEMAIEVEELNLRLKALGRKYLLIGPGRWGTRDKWLGIPVKWPQISCAKVIVEYALEGFRIDASMGSHFFHNVTSMNIGYFSVAQNSGESFIDWEWLRKQELVEEGVFFTHSRIQKEIAVIMDGRKGTFVVFKDTEQSREVHSCAVDFAESEIF